MGCEGFKMTSQNVAYLSHLLTCEPVLWVYRDFAEHFVYCLLITLLSGLWHRHCAILTLSQRC